VVRARGSDGTCHTIGRQRVHSPDITDRVGTGSRPARIARARPVTRCSAARTLSSEKEPVSAVTRSGTWPQLLTTRRSIGSRCWTSGAWIVSASAFDSLRRRRSVRCTPA
jgi:hypothetical protein